MDAKKESSPTDRNRLNALTFDVEDYFQVSAFEHFIARDAWDTFASRVVPNTRRLLRLCERTNTQATFFVLGWVAERYPSLIREIHHAGHEIGSHGYWHRLIYDQTPEEFHADVRRARDVLTDIIGCPIRAYRAPSFSIIESTLWALEILAEEGYEIDSSIFPVHHDRYGIPQAAVNVHRLETASGRIWECPPSIVRMGPWNLPVAGGGYFRLLPIGWMRRCIRKVVSEDRPFVLYLHPWEVDPDQPRMTGGSRMSRFRHYVNLRSTEAKLERLVTEFRFGRLSDVLPSEAPGGIV